MEYLGSLEESKVPLVHMHYEDGLGTCVMRIYNLCSKDGLSMGKPNSRI